MSTEAQKRASAKYSKENVIRITLNLYKGTDPDIIEKMQSLDNMQGYIKDLIRKDISSTKEGN